MTCSMVKFVLHSSLTLSDEAQSGCLLSTLYVPGGFSVSVRRQLYTFLIMKLHLDELWCPSALSMTSSGLRYRKNLHQCLWQDHPVSLSHFPLVLIWKEIPWFSSLGCRRPRVASFFFFNVCYNGLPWPNVAPWAASEGLAVLLIPRCLREFSLSGVWGMGYGWTSSQRCATLTVW